MDTFTPLTPEQFQSAQKAGFSTDQIIANEQRRKSESPSTTPAPSGFSPSTQAKKAVSSIPDAVNTAGNALSKVFPGAQLGKDLGSSLYGIEQGIKGGIQKLTGNDSGSEQSFQNYRNAADSISPIKDAGDAVNIAATVGSPAIGGATVPARIGANAAIGGIMGGANAVSQGQPVSNVVKTAGLGGLLGGGMSAVGEGIATLTKHLPSWFVQKALPKLNPENTDFALQKLDASSVKTNAVKAAQAVDSSGKVINSMLNHPNYVTETGNIKSVIPSVLQAFPNAGITSKQVVSEIQSLAPKNALLVKKVADGTANLAEQNILRQELDRAVYPSIADKINPKLPFTKQIAKTVADALRKNVQTTAPETIPAFEQFSKEINLSNALKVAQAKIQKGSGVSMYDIIAAAGGGLPSVIAERAARSASVGIMAAKGINKAAQSPLLNTLPGAAKAPLIKLATNK